MRALMIQHDHICTPGFVGERFTDRGYDLVLHRVVPEAHFRSPYVETQFPAPTNFDVIITMGAPWSVYDHETIGSWVLPELAMLREANVDHVPVFGICFGGQLLAAAHGGSVSRAAAPELGWVEIESDDESLVPGGEWFQWHYDRWELPDAATELARNANSSQAFIIDRNLAVQFHPEMNSAILASWMATGGTEEMNALNRDVDELVRQTAERDASNRERAHKLVDLFLDHVAVRSEVGHG